MNLSYNKSWKGIFEPEFEKQYFSNLMSFIDETYKTKTCYPPKKDLFAAFEYCSFKNLKVVIIGQDPYHGNGQANGLCFSVHDGIKHPPSLVNILKEVSDNYNTLYPATGNLLFWAKQGVLLLNTILTVEEAKPGSHQNKGWEVFTDAVIKAISKEKEHVVFMLWGGYAKKKMKLIDSEKHYILSSGHPSPLSANRGLWFGNKHFLKANELLKKKKKAEINWQL